MDTPAAGPRYGHTANADCDEDMLIIFGGAREDGVTNDLWTYTFATGEWLRFQTDIAPPPRMFHSMVTTLCEGLPDPFDIHLTLHGGQLANQAGAMDVWQFHMSVCYCAIHFTRPFDCIVADGPRAMERRVLPARQPAASLRPPRFRHRQPHDDLGWLAQRY